MGTVVRSSVVSRVERKRELEPSTVAQVIVAIVTVLQNEPSRKNASRINMIRINSWSVTEITDAEERVANRNGG